MVILIALLLMGIGLGVFTFWGWFTKAESINIFLIVALVLVTAIYAKESELSRKATEDLARATKEMADEMKEQRQAAARPIIDIKVQSSAEEGVRIGVYIMMEGELPSEITCLLTNIGLGPAIDVYPLVADLNGGGVPYCLGTIAVSEKTGEMRLFLGQRGGRRVLVVNYQDVYAQRWESSREVSGDKEEGSFKIGPLRTYKLAKEEPT